MLFFDIFSEFVQKSGRLWLKMVDCVIFFHKFVY